MTADELRPGMTGYGLTVLEGTRIDTFQVEIVGVRKNYFPQSDMILARASGLGLDRIGIAAGMSGSPIYIEGRLIGALAYGWPFMVTPIMGITPIEAMLEIDARAVESAGEPGRGGGLSGSGARAAWDRLLVTRGVDALPLVTALDPAPDRTALSRGAAELPGAARPIGTPLWLGGFDDRLFPVLAEWLGPAGLVPLAAGSGGGADGPGAESLQPGAAVGVDLVRGDASAAAIGTVTLRDGDRILAFGHPFFHRGRSALPLSTATIQTVMPRLDDSFKFGSTARPVGVMDMDLRSGIGGRIGPVPAMIPVTVSIDDPLAGPAQTFRYEVATDEQLSGILAAWVTANSLLTNGKESGDATLDITTRMTLLDGRALETRNVAAAAFLPLAVAAEVARPAGLLLRNPLERVMLASVTVSVRIRHEMDVLTLDAVALATSRVESGKPLDVLVTLRNYRGDRIERRVAIPVPKELPAGAYALRVEDAGSFAQWDSQRAPGLYNVESVDQILAILSAEPPFNTLVVTLSDTRAGVSARGDDLGRLPPSVLSALSAPGVEGSYALTRGGVVSRQDVTLTGMVGGSRELSITVTEGQ